MSRVLLLILCVACKGGPGGLTAYEPPNVVVGEQPPYVGGFLVGQLCDVRSVLEVGCVAGCHSGLVPEGGLDLETDPFPAIVNQPSQINGALLVSPGDPEGSLLYRKMAGTQALDEGAIMPPTGLLDPVFLTPLRAWIADGAPDDCQYGYVEETYEGDEPYHPPDWRNRDQHGRAANLQTDGDCRSCHGGDLTGGTAGVSCDSCHSQGWRTDCTFCHGGQLNATGAPPRDVDGVTDPNLISFRAHPAHVAGDRHPAYGCEQCHRKPTDVLTPGHIFDDVTAGYGEIYYANGLSPYATYLNGTCSNTYCHGTGRADDGTVSDGDGPLGCGSCHGEPDSPSNVLAQMSGRHKFHLDRGALCAECHSTVVNADMQIIGPTYHVDGQPTVQPIGVTWNNGTCNGACHEYNHQNRNW